MSSFRVLHLLPSDTKTGTVFDYEEERFARTVPSGMDFLVSQTRLREVPYSKLMPSCSSMGRQADEEMHRRQ